MAQTIGSGQSNDIRDSTAALTATPRYTKSLDASGWLRIKLEPSGKFTLLCEFVKVVIIKEKDSRTFFRILEGAHKGEIGSLNKDNASKCLIESVRSSGAKLTATISGRKKLISVPRGGQEINQLTAKLEFDGKSATITLDSDIDFTETNPLSPNYGQMVHSKPLPKGIYKILTPEASKKPDATAFYVTSPGGYPDLKYHTVWFQIENPATQNSNYVHVGHLSEGCVTMYELAMWNSLYSYLISNRMDKEGKYVGTVTIK